MGCGVSKSIENGTIIVNAGTQVKDNKHIVKEPQKRNDSAISRQEKLPDSHLVHPSDVTLPTPVLTPNHSNTTPQAQAVSAFTTSNPTFSPFQHNPSLANQNTESGHYVSLSQSKSVIDQWEQKNGKIDSYAMANGYANQSTPNPIGKVSTGSLFSSSLKAKEMNIGGSVFQSGTAINGANIQKTSETELKTLERASAGPLAKPVIPHIKSEKEGLRIPDARLTNKNQAQEDDRRKGIAFEIPLDDATEASRKLSLPKVALSNEELAKKLGNTEDKWKNLDKSAKTYSTYMRKPMAFQTGAKRHDPEHLRQLLREKEAVAQRNRERELLKIQAKLERHDQHTREVLERKKKLEEGVDEELGLAQPVSQYYGETTKPPILGRSNTESKISLDNSVGDGNTSRLSWGGEGKEWASRTHSFSTM